MGYDGSLKFDTKIDRSGFEKGLNKMKTATTVAVGAIVAGFGAATKAGMDFEAGMSKVGAISMATAADMEILTEKAKQMGIETVFSATQSAEAFQYMAMAGWKTEDMLNGIEGIMNLAAASGEDLAMVSDIVTDALTAFGLQAKDSAHFSDVLATASSNANTNVALMGETFKYVAPVAGALGFSVEDTSVAIGLMANAGIKGSQAGTALRSTLSRLSKPTKQTQVAMDALGISLTDSDGKMKSLNELMLDMRDSFSGLATEQKAAYAAMLGGQEAMSGLLAIVNASEADFNKLTNAVNNADGAAKEMSETMLDNLSGQLTLMQSSAEGLGIAIYDGIQEPLKEAAKASIESINKITDSLKGGEMAGALEDVGSLFGDLVKIIIKLVSSTLPPLIKLLSALGRNTKEISTLVLASVVAFKSYSIINTISKWITANSAVWTKHAIAVTANTAAETRGIGVSMLLMTTMSAQEIAVGVLTGKISLLTAAKVLATKAQMALNAAWIANPVGVVIAGVALLTGALAALCIAVDTETEAEKTHRLAVEENRKAVEESTTAIKERKEAMAESATEGLSSIAHTKSLANELLKLADADGKVAESQKGRASFILGQLNEALGTEYKMVNGIIVNYQNLQDEIFNTIEAKKFQILAESGEETYKQAILEKSEAQRNYALALQEASDELVGYTEKQKAVTEAKKALDEHMANRDSFVAANGLAEYNEKCAELTDALDVATVGCERYLSNHKEVLNNYWSAKAACDENTAAISRYESAMSMAETDIQGAISAMEDYTNAATNGTMASSEFADGTEEKIADLGSTVETKLIAYQSALSEYAKTGSETAKAMVNDAYNELINSVDEYEAAGGSMANGIVTGFNAEGVVSKLDLNFLLGNIEGLELRAEEKAKSVGEYFGDGVEGGIRARIDVVKTASADLIKEAIKAAKEAGIIRSPSRKTRDEVGKMLGLGVAVGIEESTEETKKAFQKMLDVLEYQRKFDIINDEKYYEELKKLRDEYFEVGTKEWFDYTEKIYSYEKECVENQKEEIRALYDDIAKYAEENIGKVIEAQQKLETKLKDYGNFYKQVTINAGGEETSLFTFGDLEKDNKALEEYKNALVKAKACIADSGFDIEKTKGIFEMMVNLDVDEGTKFANMISNSSDFELNNQLANWIKNQELSETISKELYNDEFTTAVDKTKKYMTEELEKAGLEIPEDFTLSGTISAENFGEAFVIELDNQLEKIRAKISAFNSSLVIGASGGDGIKVNNDSSGDTPTNVEVNQTFNFTDNHETSREKAQAWQNEMEILKRTGNML